MIQKIMMTDSRNKMGMARTNKTQSAAVYQNYSSNVSFTAAGAKTTNLLKDVGAFFKSLFNRAHYKFPIADPYLNKSFSQVCAELKSSDIFKPKSILSETESGKILKLIHPVDGGLERILSFDNHGMMTDLVVYHPEPTLLKREFSIKQGGQFSVKDYQ